MSMLARYKKNDKSFLELVKLIEGSVGAKREQLMKMVRDEDPAFAEKVAAHIIDFDTIRGLSDGMIAEIVAATPPKILALILMGEKDENFKKIVEKSIGKKFAEVKSEKEVIADQEITDAKMIPGQIKMIAETRKLVESGAIKIAPKAISGVSTESASSPSATAGASTANNPSIAGASLGSASESDGCPPIQSFGITKPPSGLMGERFEEFLNKKLA